MRQISCRGSGVSRRTKAARCRLHEDKRGGVITETTDASAQQGLTDQASAKGQDSVWAAQEKSSELREQCSMRLRDQFAQRSNEAGSQVRSLSESLRRSGN